ncbi:hypothetical protein WJX73_010439 [Symbiochloris irregularis]|uniref:Uncharacterized protein n=1 Tax=Symbiochloris irregularis TaxID=706552 RepID=A0AAW1P489_9CHLO
MAFSSDIAVAKGTATRSTQGLSATITSQIATALRFVQATTPGCRLKHGHAAVHIRAAAAANTLPAYHPLLSLPGKEVQSYLQQIARTKSSLPPPRVLGIWPGESSDISTFNSFAKINHQGTQFIARKGGAVVISGLDLDSGQTSSAYWCNLVCAPQRELFAIEANDGVGLFTCHSKALDDTKVSIDFKGPVDEDTQYDAHAFIFSTRPGRVGRMLQAVPGAARIEISPDGIFLAALVKAGVEADRWGPQ